MLPLILTRGGSNCMMARIVIDLPLPDSPTIPMVSPTCTLKLMSSRIVRGPVGASNTIDKFFTSMAGVP
jgi:hypothetical protein